MSYIWMKQSFKKVNISSQLTGNGFKSLLTRSEQKLKWTSFVSKSNKFGTAETSHNSAVPNLFDFDTNDVHNKKDRMKISCDPLYYLNPITSSLLKPKRSALLNCYLPIYRCNIQEWFPHDFNLARTIYLSHNAADFIIQFVKLASISVMLDWNSLRIPQTYSSWFPFFFGFSLLFAKYCNRIVQNAHADGFVSTKAYGTVPKSEMICVYDNSTLQFVWIICNLVLWITSLL